VENHRLDSQVGSVAKIFEIETLSFLVITLAYRGKNKLDFE